jgi:hypothetical protein
MWRKLVALGLALAILATPVGATITVPNVFTPFSTISSSQVNTNFSTIAANALDKRGDSMSGTLNTQVILPDITATRTLGSASFKFLDGFFSGVMTAGSLVLAGSITGATTGAFSSNITVGGNANVTGTLQVAGTTTLGFVNTGAAASSSLTLSTPLVISSGGTNSTATPTNGGVGYGTGSAHAYTAAGTAGQYLVSAGAGVPVWTGRTTVFNAGNTGAAITLNFNTNGLVQQITRNASTTITLTAPPLSGTVIVVMVHDGTAGAYTVAYSPAVKFPSGTAPTYTNTAAAVDIITLYWDGSAWYGAAQLAFA